MKRLRPDLKNSGYDYQEGDLIVFVRKAIDGRIYEPLIGKFKRYNGDRTKCFVYYHSGETASCTDIEDIYELGNPRYIKTNLGSMEEYK